MRRCLLLLCKFPCVFVCIVACRCLYVFASTLYFSACKILCINVGLSWQIMRWFCTSMVYNSLHVNSLYVCWNLTGFALYICITHLNNASGPSSIDCNRTHLLVDVRIASVMVGVFLCIVTLTLLFFDVCLMIWVCRRSVPLQEKNTSVLPTSRTRLLTRSYIDNSRRSVQIQIWLVACLYVIKCSCLLLRASIPLWLLLSSQVSCICMMYYTLISIYYINVCITQRSHARILYQSGCIVSALNNIFLPMLCVCISSSVTTLVVLLLDTNK